LDTSYVELGIVHKSTSFSGILLVYLSFIAFFKAGELLRIYWDYLFFTLLLMINAETMDGHNNFLSLKL